MPFASRFTPESRRRLVYGGAASVLLILVGLGAFAKNGWLPHTDPLSGKRTGWFGEPLAKNAPSSWNPLAMPSPTPTPQLSKEYIYAGSRLLAVEDKNATATPPADLAVWRPGTQGVWYIRITGSTWITQNWGTSGDVPIPGDFDGDGTTDYSVFRPSNSNWYIVLSSTGSTTNFAYATSTDLPAQADYDGDGKTDPAVYRPPTGGATYGVWHIQGTTAGYYTQTWGEAGDVPASADYDGDGRADIAVFRGSNSNFYSINSSNLALQTVSMSQTGTPVSGDYDGDGKADYALFKASTAYWYVRQSTNSTIVSTQWGSANDVPVHNDYDADGKVDLAAWTPSGTNEGRWHIRNSTDNSTRDVVWGQQYDIPVPAFYRR